MRRAVVHGLLPLMYVVLVLVPLAAGVTLSSPSFPSTAIAGPDVAFSSTSGLAGVPGRRATLLGITVVLDPGHNGASAWHPEEINRPVPNGRGGTKACNTTGTATDGGYPEHAFNWDVALGVRDVLTARGAQVVLTRPDDAGGGPCVNDRAAIANQAGAAALVSIHADGAVRFGHGFHVAYSDPPLNRSFLIFAALSGCDQPGWCVRP